jgi:hypothetical protein
MIRCARMGHDGGRTTASLVGQSSEFEFIFLARHQRATISASGCVRNRPNRVIRRCVVGLDTDGTAEQSVRKKAFFVSEHEI